MADENLIPLLQLPHCASIIFEELIIWTVSHNTIS
jgi:hypothetical protein